MTTYSKYGKPIGRPKGAVARDYKPRVIDLVSKYRILEHAIKLFDKEKHSMSTKDQLAYSKVFIDFALAASPKSLSVEPRSQFMLVVEGLGDTPGAMPQDVSDDKQTSHELLDLRSAARAAHKPFPPAPSLRPYHEEDDGNGGLQ